MAELVNKIRQETPSDKIIIQIRDTQNNYSRSMTVKDAPFLDVYTKVLKAMRDLEEE